MYTFVLSIHILLAVVLVTLVLLQQGKGADIGAVMSGGANSLFGVGGASSVLVRMTTLIAICFMLTSVLLVKLGTGDNIGVGGRVDVLEGLDQSNLKGPSPASEAAPEAPKAPEAVPPASAQ